MVEDPNHKYPLLVFLGSNLGQQNVNKKWDFSYLDFIASTHKIFVTVIDTHGSDGYGLDYSSPRDKDTMPGEMEKNDILKVVEKLETDEVVDSDRIAILGMVT